jgi:hypothetical protein
MSHSSIVVINILKQLETVPGLRSITSPALFENRMRYKQQKSFNLTKQNWYKQEYRYFFYFGRLSILPVQIKCRYLAGGTSYPLPVSLQSGYPTDFSKRTKNSSSA